MSRIIRLITAPGADYPHPLHRDIYGNRTAAPRGWLGWLATVCGWRRG